MRHLACWTTLLVVFFFEGCAYPLKVKVEARPESLRDRSAVSTKATGPKVTGLIILPPAEASRGTFETYARSFERIFLNRGLRVVSPSITGRVVREQKTENAAQLPDIERALILAKETHVDALLQIGMLEFKGTRSRYFCGTTAESVSACTDVKFREAEYGRDLNGPLFELQARLIDANSAEVLAAFEMSTAVVDYLEASLASPENQDPKPVGRCSDCKSGSWWCRKCAEAEKKAIEALMDGLVERVANQSTSGQ